MVGMTKNKKNKTVGYNTSYQLLTSWFAREFRFLGVRCECGVKLWCGSNTQMLLRVKTSDSAHLKWTKCWERTTMQGIVGKRDLH